MELNNEIYSKILELCSNGDKMVEKGEFDKAIQDYKRALDLVPPPKNTWDTSTWIYTALGDTYFLKSDYKEAIEYFYNAMNCPDGLNNPFILLRLGQSLYNVDEKTKAKEYLLRAYMLEGLEIFQEEDDKYLQLILNDIKEL